MYLFTNTECTSLAGSTSDSKATMAWCKGRVGAVNQQTECGSFAETFEMSRKGQASHTSKESPLHRKRIG
jgi:hypothetical protein